MNVSPSKTTPTRIRASNACQRCSRRKIKCDAATAGVPSSRCRSDGLQDCKLNASQRGRYSRKKQLVTPQSAASQPPKASNTQHEARDHNSAVGSIRATINNEFAVNAAETTLQADDGTVSHHAPLVQDQLPSADNAHNYPSRLSVVRSTSTADLERQAVDSVATGLGDRGTPRSLHAMFEDFLRRQGVTDDEMAERIGFVLLSESSPLTFALEEIRKGTYQSIPSIEHQALRGSRTDALAIESPNNRHPSHMTVSDIAYLQSKGAFELPEQDVLDALIQAFTNRFNPLYSIVDIDELYSLYRQQKLSWLLLHAVCFIGSTFCDASIIHQSRYRRRGLARRVFYDKTKVLFDLSYETNEIVLLQSVLMLTFWGSHMKTYWNPSTWVDFATTIAASLGIHRTSGLAQYAPKDQRLLRRLWSVVLARDASCATLLGRPFRIRMSQCDAVSLTLDDFQNPDTTEVQDELHALYQIHSSKLSLILRQIVQGHADSGFNGDRQSSLQARLTEWQEELPAVLDGTRQTDQRNVFASSLMITFEHHLILLYLGTPGQHNMNADFSNDMTSSQIDTMVSAAQTISSSALTLMVHSSVSSLAHEVFPGFFIAGVVFYRQSQQHQQTHLAQLQRSALDNCQMILNDAREGCDAAQWMMRVFEFLLSDTSSPRKHAPMFPGSDAASAAKQLQGGANVNRDSTRHIRGFTPDARDLSMLSMDFELPFQNGFDILDNDFFFLPDLYVPAAGDAADM